MQLTLEDEMRIYMIAVVLITVIVSTFNANAQPWARTSGALTANMNMADEASYRTQIIDDIECRVASLGRLPEKAQITDIDIYVSTGFGAGAPKDSVSIGTLTDIDFITVYASVQNEGIVTPTWNTATDGHSYNVLHGTGRDLYLIYWKSTAWPTVGKVTAVVTYAVHKRSLR